MEENCDNKLPPVTFPCKICGKPIIWYSNKKKYTVCNNCVSPKTLYMRNYGQRKKLPRKIVKGKHGEKNKIRELKRAFIDRPCYLCDYKNCSGSNKVIICTTGKTFQEETGQYGVQNCKKEELIKFLDSNRFILMCSHHGRQYTNLKVHRPTYSHEELIAEMLRRMTT